MPAAVSMKTAARPSMPFRSADLHSPHTADPEAPVVLHFPAVGDLVLLTVLLEALWQHIAGAMDSPLVVLYGNAD